MTTPMPDYAELPEMSETTIVEYQTLQVVNIDAHSNSQHLLGWQNLPVGLVPGGGGKSPSGVD